ncbi:sodium/potassium/calcium exchanger 1-like [Polyodon spathula]|uniref:sodium/potassium/calcium exchanger 1-like n=1 Tax=Polyodon spathula TaxID=7913 RepID=UPI001B7D9C96|nr:sodium/potassium/calcium exchanger 1-like [Polyodon spathula]
MIKSFQEQPETGIGVFQKKGGQRDCSKKVDEAVKMAKKAQKLSLKKRLSQFGFRSRYDEEERLSSEDSDTAEVLGIFLTDSSRRGERCSPSDEEHRPKPSKKRKKTLSKGKSLSLGKAQREKKEKKEGKVSEEEVKNKSKPRFSTKNKPLEISTHKAPVRKFALPKTRDQRVPGGETSPENRTGEETGAPTDPEQETLYSFTWSKTNNQAAELHKRAGEEGEGEAGESPKMRQGEGVQEGEEEEEESITLVLRGEEGSEGEEGSKREEGSLNKAVLGYPLQDKGFDKGGGGGGGKDLPMFSEDDEDEDMEILTCRQAVETALEEDFSLFLFEEE